MALTAGTAATAIFVIGQLPMLIKARRTRDLSSYSLANIGLANLGNLLYTVYLATVPIGTAWVLHGFNLVTTALMLFWCLRYGRRALTTRTTNRTDPAAADAGVRREP